LNCSAMRGPIVLPSHPVVASVKEALTPFPSFQPMESEAAMVLIDYVEKAEMALNDLARGHLAGLYRRRLKSLWANPPRRSCRCWGTRG
jgi:hypothetical protein